MPCDMGCRCASVSAKFGAKKSNPAPPRIAIDTRKQNRPENTGSSISAVSDFKTAKLSEISSQV
jgi:hypothetical protein